MVEFLADVFDDRIDFPDDLRRALTLPAALADFADGDLKYAGKCDPFPLAISGATAVVPLTATGPETGR